MMPRSITWDCLYFVMLSANSLHVLRAFQAQARMSVIGRLQHYAAQSKFVGKETLPRSFDNRISAAPILPTLSFRVGALTDFECICFFFALLIANRFLAT